MVLYYDIKCGHIGYLFKNFTKSGLPVCKPTKVFSYWIPNHNMPRYPDKNGTYLNVLNNTNLCTTDPQLTDNI